MLFNSIFAGGYPRTTFSLFFCGFSINRRRFVNRNPTRGQKSVLGTRNHFPSLKLVPDTFPGSSRNSLSGDTILHIKNESVRKKFPGSSRNSLSGDTHIEFLDWNHFRDLGTTSHPRIRFWTNFLIPLIITCSAIYYYILKFWPGTIFGI